MLKDITIGQYFPGDSFVHRLDPRVKIFTVALFMISIFFINQFVIYLPLVLFLLFIIYSAKLPLLFVLKGIRPLLFIIVLTLVINVFMTPGEVLFHYGILTITREGIYQGAFMALRLMFLVIGTSLLTLTTSPIALTDAMENIMKPLSKMGFPSHELAMMMTIALRFIPTLFEETDKIMKAQMARGADFESGNIINRAKNLVPLLVPLFINSFRRADELATAMEARCYRGGENRTRLNELKYQAKDYIAMGISLIFFGGIIVSKFVL